MKNKVHKSIKIQIASCPTHLPVVRAAIDKLCQMMGFDVKSAGDVVLSVDEALANIIKHAYHGDHSLPIEVDLTPGVKSLRIVLRDYGRSVHPSELKSRDLDDVRPGGLGVHIMKSCMDKFEYAPSDDGVGSVLTMVKCIQNSKGKQDER